MWECGEDRQTHTDTQTAVTNKHFASATPHAKCNIIIMIIYRVSSKELRERLGIDDIILILQQNRLRWYGHVLRKEHTD